MDFSRVDLLRLKAVTCRLIDELVRQTGNTSFQLPDADCYWKIPADQAIVKEQDPSTFTFHVGRLRDDWQLIQSIADQPMDQWMTPYSLTEVAPLLDYIGNSVAASNDGRQE